MTKAWYFDAHECTPCDVICTSVSGLVTEIEIRGARTRTDSLLIAETFHAARTGRLGLISEAIERKRREIELAQADITKALTLLEQAIADDGVRDDEPRAP